MACKTRLEQNDHTFAHHTVIQINEIYNCLKLFIFNLVHDKTKPTYQVFYTQPFLKNK